MLTFDDDLDEFFDDCEHALECYFNGSCFLVIANQEFIDAEMGGDEEERESTVVYTRTKNVLNIRVGDTITLEGKKLYVLGNQPDRTGISNLILTDTSPNKP